METLTIRPQPEHEEALMAYEPHCKEITQLKAALYQAEKELACCCVKILIKNHSDPANSPRSSGVTMRNGGKTPHSFMWGFDILLTLYKPRIRGV